MQKKISFLGFVLFVVVVIVIFSPKDSVDLRATYRSLLSEARHQDLPQEREARHQDLLLERGARHQDLPQESGARHQDLLQESGARHQDLPQESEARHQDFPQESGARHQDLLQENVATIPLPSRLMHENKVHYSPSSVPEDLSYMSIQLPLSEELIRGIRVFVFFIGHGRSGHSILGSVINAHPHAVIAKDMYLFKRWSQWSRVEPERWTGSLFNHLYRKSLGNRQMEQNSKKGYTAFIDGLWQGKVDGYISVIGDKSGGSTTKEYMKNKRLFLERYRELKERLSISIRVIHAVRNPFDQIATTMMYEVGNSSSLLQLKMLLSDNTSVGDDSWKYNDQIKLESVVNQLFDKYSAVMEMTDHFGRESVLQVHNSDFVHNPGEVISMLCRFLELDCTDHFLRVCSRKVYKTVSRSRDLVMWSGKLRRRVEDRMKKYPMFDRYNFTSD